MHDKPPQKRRVGYLPTLSLLAYLATLIVWEIEIGLLLAHWAGIDLDLAVHVAAAIIAIALTVFAWRHRIHFSAITAQGSVAVTGFQGLLIAILFFVFAGVLTWIYATVVGRP